MNSKSLFDDDLEKIDNAVIQHAMGSYQIGEIARLSALLYDRGIDVIKELKKLHNKFGVTNEIERGKRRMLDFLDE